MTVSRIVPLDITLFGWPQVPPTSPLQELGLLIGVPLVVIVIVFAVAKGNAVMKASKRGPGPYPEDPVWMGGRARSIMGGAEDELPALSEGERRALESSSTGSAATSGSRTSTTATAEPDAGGASARW